MAEGKIQGRNIQLRSCGEFGIEEVGGGWGCVYRLVGPTTH